MSSPSLVAPWKNSTLATVPSVSDAVALMVIVAGAVKVALLAGEVMLTSGLLFLLPARTGGNQHSNSAAIMMRIFFMEQLLKR